MLRFALHVDVLYNATIHAKLNKRLNKLTFSFPNSTWVFYLAWMHRSHRNAPHTHTFLCAYDLGPKSIALFPTSPNDRFQQNKNTTNPNLVRAHKTLLIVNRESLSIVCKYSCVAYIYRLQCHANVRVCVCMYVPWTYDSLMGSVQSTFPMSPMLPSLHFQTCVLFGKWFFVFSYWALFAFRLLTLLLLLFRIFSLMIQFICSFCSATE